MINPTISSHGYSDAAIVFIGGFPLKEDLAQGLALAGTQGRTLNTFLNAVDLNLNMCYRTLYIREKLSYSGRSPKRLREALKEVGEEEYEQLLFEELLEIKPNVIVPLDDLALSIVFPHINTFKKPRGRKYWLNCYRGSILPLRPDWQIKLGPIVRVIPTFGPQMLYSEWSVRSYIHIDFKRIAKHQFNRAAIIEPGLCWVAKDSRKLGTFLNRQYEKKPKRLTFDIETYGGLITCISLCFDAYESVTVPLLDESIPVGEMALLWKMVARILSDPVTEKSNQNIKYDWIILERHGFKVSNVRSDTMLKTGLLYPELPKGLDFLTSIYTDIPYYKDEGKEFNPKIHSRDRLYLYCAKDSLAAQQISLKQDEELVEGGMKDLYETEVAPSILIYKNIDETGLFVDEETRLRKLDKYSYWFDSNLDILRRMVNLPDFNPASPPQTGKLLYEQLKFPAKRKLSPLTGKQAYVTDKETLDELLITIGSGGKSGELGRQVLIRVTVCRKLKKIKEFLETPLHPDGTMRGSYNVAGTETGRTSCSQTIDEFLLNTDEFKPNKTRQTKRLGRSLQTISKHGFQVDADIFNDIEAGEIAHDLRSIFVPHHGYVFIECDGNQAEDRVVCILAEDYAGLADCDKLPKKHSKTAALLFDIDVDSITKARPKIPKMGIAYYDMGKRIRHAGNYNQTAYGIAQKTHLPLGLCMEKLNIFHSSNPNIRGVFHAEIRNFVQQHRFLITPFTRRRDFFAKLNDKLYQEAFAYIPQSVIGDLTKFTMWRIAEALPGYMRTYKFLVEAHDGILAEVKKDMQMQFAHSFQQCYERPVNFRNCSLPRDHELIVPAEVSISLTNWMEMKEVEL